MDMEHGISAMGINTGIILFILVMLGIMVIFAGFLWLLYWLINKSYKWISQRNFFVEFRQRRQGRKKAMPRKRKLSVQEFLAEVFAEPVILTVAIVIAYDHFKAIWDTAPDFATFWVRINETTRGNMLVWIFLTIALILWMTVVTSRRIREERRDKAFEELQETNTDKVVKAIERLTDEIRKGKKTDNGKPTTGM